MFFNLLAITLGLLWASSQCLNVVAAPAPQADVTTTASDTDAFALYAYGSNNTGTVIGGLQVFYADG